MCKKNVYCTSTSTLTMLLLNHRTYDRAHYIPNSISILGVGIINENAQIICGLSLHRAYPLCWYTCSCVRSRVLYLYLKKDFDAKLVYLVTRHSSFEEYQIHVTCISITFFSVCLCATCQFITFIKWFNAFLKYMIIKLLFMYKY